MYQNGKMTRDVSFPARQRQNTTSSTHIHFSGVNSAVRRSPLISSVVFLLFVVVVVVVVVVLPGVLVLLAAIRSASVMVMMAVEDFVVVARMGPSAAMLAATADGDRRGVMRILLPHCLVEPPQHVVERVVRHGCFGVLVCA